MQLLIPKGGEIAAGWPSSQNLDSLCQIDVEFTSACNLRCVYCPVSSPTYHGVTMPKWLIDSLKDNLLDKNIRHIGINGHGETTYVEGWTEASLPFLKIAKSSHLISNFARLFDQTELDVLAHVGTILVSLDTADPELLKEIRRKVDLRNVLTNIINVRAAAIRLGLPQPKFQINAGIYDRNILGLPDLARLCIALKVDTMSFWSLVVHSVFVDDVKCDTVASLSASDLNRGVQAIDETIQLLAEHGIKCVIPGDFVESIRQMAAEKMPAAA